MKIALEQQKNFNVLIRLFVMLTLSNSPTYFLTIIWDFSLQFILILYTIKDLVFSHDLNLDFSMTEPKEFLKALTGYFFI